ncbi:MAG TPA: YggT family protein [Candidatus Paceibacterota bacterium]|nr:YggT family protein [Candidatus Paceibacterota bacterium]
MTFVKYTRYVLGFFEILMGLRLLLRLLGANPVAPIVDLLYTLTAIIISPFRGIFSDIYLRSGGVLDLVTVTAMIGYPILVYLLFELVNVVARDRRESETV